MSFKRTQTLIIMMNDIRHVKMINIVINGDLNVANIIFLHPNH
jgi:hypothetical protein